MDNTNGPKWKRVAIRTELYENVERLIARREDLGYGNVARFVEDSVRRRVEEIPLEVSER